MKNKAKILVLVVVGILALVMVGVVAAQDDTPPTPEDGCFLGFCGQSGRFSRGFGGMMMGNQGGWMHDYMLDAFASALGLDPESVQGKIDDGYNLWAIAAEQGLSEDEVQELMESVHESALAAMVADGIIDQERADWMDEHMDWMFSQELTPGSGGGFGGCRGGGMGRGSGMWGGQGGRWNAPVQPDGTSS